MLNPNMAKTLGRMCLLFWSKIEKIKVIADKQNVHHKIPFFLLVNRRIIYEVTVLL